ncbi:MAG TPA: metalloregulator ArsR/SmtB family transcription factor [Pseudomonas sp.]|nr:metalloregulator ArsR/SmtB family transcription factor [Pseudomonas sp.]
MRETLTPTNVFKCLADDTRLRLMLLAMAEDELCVCELSCALDASQPKISRHLAQLRITGLLADRRQGHWIYYRLHPELPGWVLSILRSTLQANQDWLSPSAQRLACMDGRPQRATNCC